MLQEEKKINPKLITSDGVNTHRTTVSLLDNRPKSILQKKQIDSINNTQTNEVTAQLQTNNTGLPDNLKSGIENLSGHSMDDVKVHYNSSQPAQLNAHAFAQGNQIHIASGQEKHLPHEAWHVVQQKQGRVKPTKQLKSKVNINDDVSLEKEADVMGSKAQNIETGTNKKSLHSKKPLNAVSQRVIHVQPAIANNPVMQELATNSLYTNLNASANIYIRQNADKTDMVVRNTHNTDSFNADLPPQLLASNINYIISVKPAIFQNGLDMDDKRVHHSMGGLNMESMVNAVEHHQIMTSVYEMTKGGDETVPIFDIRNRMKGGNPTEDFNKPKLADSMALYSSPLYFSTSNKLSAYNVILHELGHIEQHLNTAKRYMGVGIDEITHVHVPPLPPHLINTVTVAYNAKNLRSPVWTELLDMQNTMLHWIDPFKDHNNDHQGGEMIASAEEFERLGQTIVNKAMIWIEYDNITHTEHPEAEKRGEPIRHIHGAEMMLNPARGDEIVADLSERNKATIPKKLSDVKDTMAENAHRLTTGLVAEVTRYVQLYTQLKDSLPG